MIRQHQRYFNVLRILFDGGVLAIAFLLVSYLNFGNLNNPHYGTLFLKVFLWLIPTLLSVYAYQGLYIPMRTQMFRKEALTLIQAHLMGMVLIFSIFYLTEFSPFSPDFLFCYGTASFIMLLSGRYLVRRLLFKLRARGYNQKHMLIVGAGSVGQKFAAMLRSHRDFGYTLAGFLDDDNNKKGNHFHGAPVLGRCSQLPAIIRNTVIDEVIVALPVSAYDMYTYLVDCCEREGIRMRIVFDYYEVLPGYPKIENFDGIPLLNIRHVPLDEPFNRLLKRISDLAVSSCAITLLSPLMLVIAVMIKATSKGPVFFRQERIGLNNRPFSMLKFRSMKVMSESVTDTRWTTPDDPRKTWIGTLLRKTSLDELPQFFNVFAGSMSVVGPRPERPHFVEQFKQQIPKYMVKHQVKPGITGWAQVNGWRGDTSIEKRIECDIHYIENWDLLFDLKIMLMTVLRGLINRNAY